LVRDFGVPPFTTLDARRAAALTGSVVLADLPGDPRPWQRLHEVA